LRKKFSLTEQSVARYAWAEGNPPIQARGLVLAGDILFVAGPPDVLDEEEAFRDPDDPAVREKLDAQVAALRGRKGSQLLAVSALDGKTLAAYELGAMPAFDGMIAARGRLYVSTTDGRVLCLGAEGSMLPKLGPVHMASLDISVKKSPVPAVSGKGPSKNADFDKLVQTSVTESEAGYHVSSENKKLGVALQKLAEPLTGTVELKTRMRATSDGHLKNCFVVFGDGPDEARLVKCGLRYAMRKAMIVEGAISGAKGASEAFEADVGPLYDTRITVDLDAGKVTMKVGQTTVVAALKAPPARITHVGFGVVDAAAELASIEISRK